MVQLYKFANYLDNYKKYSNLTQDKIDEIVQQAKEVFEKQRNGEMLTEKDKKKLEEYDLLVKYGLGIDPNNMPELVSDDQPTSLHDYTVDVLGTDLDDYKKQLIGNPLFPGVLRTELRKNYLSKEKLEPEIKKVYRYLKTHEDAYNQASAEIAKVQQPLDQYRRSEEQYEAAKTKYQEKEKEKDELVLQQQQYEEKLEVAEAWLDDLATKDTFKDILTIYPAIDPDEAFKLGVYKSEKEKEEQVDFPLSWVGDDIQKVCPYLIQVWKKGKTLEAEQTKLEQLMTSYEDEKEEFAKLNGEASENGKTAAIMARIKASYDKLNMLEEKIAKQEQKVHKIKLIREGNISEAHLIDPNGNVLVWQSLDIDPVTEEAKYKAIPDEDITWDFIESVAKFLEKWYKHTNTFAKLTGIYGEDEDEDEDEDVDKRKKRRGIIDALKHRIDACETAIKKIKEEQDKIKDIFFSDTFRADYFEAKSISDGIALDSKGNRIDDESEQTKIMRKKEEYDRNVQIVNEYEQQRDYYDKLMRYTKTIQYKTKKNTAEVLDEEKHMATLENTISTLTQSLAKLQEEYDHAKSLAKDERGQSELSTIIDYEAAQRQLKAIKEQYNDLDRTVSEKLTDVDVKSINTQKVAEEINNLIIRRVIAKKSLLGILLTQSVEAFAQAYLHNSNYNVPEIEQTLGTLIHYYEDDKPKENNNVSNIKNNETQTEQIKPTNFLNEENNEIILQKIFKLLMTEKDNNLFQMFLDILKIKYKHIYKALDLPYAQKEYLFVEDKQHNGQLYRRGPFLDRESICKFYNKDRQIPLKPNDCSNGKTFLIFNGKQSLTVIVKLDRASGQEFQTFISNSTPNEAIIELFKKVENLFKEYIRTRLSRLAYQMKRTVGLPFYGVSLAASIVPNIQNLISISDLEKYIGTKDKNSAELASEIVNSNINMVKKEIMQQLCDKFVGDPTANKYIMLVEFLKLHNIYDDAMNQYAFENTNDYIKRLKEKYHRVMEIFENELDHHIKRRINLCTYELEARDKTKYNKLVNRSVNNDQVQVEYTIQLYGIEEDGHVKQEGVVHKLKNISAQLKDLFNQVEKILRANFEQINTDVFNKIYEEIKQSLTNQNEYDRKKQFYENQLKQIKQDSTSSELKNNPRIKAIQYMLQAFQILDKGQLKQQCITTIAEYNKLIAKQNLLQDYLNTTTSAASQIFNTQAMNSLATNYKKLLGAKNSPLVAYESYLKETKKLKSQQDVAKIEEYKRKANISLDELESKITREITVLYSSSLVSDDEKEEFIKKYGAYGKMLLAFYEFEAQKQEVKQFKDKQSDAYSILVKRCEKAEHDYNTAKQKVEALKRGITGLIETMMSQLPVAEENENMDKSILKGLQDNLGMFARLNESGITTQNSKHVISDLSDDNDYNSITQDPNEHLYGKRQQAIEKALDYQERRREFNRMNKGSEDEKNQAIQESLGLPGTGIVYDAETMQYIEILKENYPAEYNIFLVLEDKARTSLLSKTPNTVKKLIAKVKKDLSSTYKRILPLLVAAIEKKVKEKIRIELDQKIRETETLPKTNDENKNDENENAKIDYYVNAEIDQIMKSPETKDRIKKETTAMCYRKGIVESNIYSVLLHNPRFENMSSADEMIAILSQNYNRD